MLLHHIGRKLKSDNKSKFYYHRFIMMLINHFIPNANEIFGTDNVCAAYNQQKRLFLDMKRTHDNKAASFGPMMYPVRAHIVLSTYNSPIYNASFFGGELPQEPAPVVFQVTTQLIPTPVTKTHIEQQPLLLKTTYVASQQAPVVRNLRLRMLPSSDSEEENLTLDKINKKKQLKAAVALSKPIKPTSYVVSQKTIDFDKGKYTLTSVSQKLDLLKKAFSHRHNLSLHSLKRVNFLHTLPVEKKGNISLTSAYIVSKSITQPLSSTFPNSIDHIKIYFFRD